MTYPARTVRIAVFVLALSVAACGGNGDERTPAGETVDADTVLRDTVAVVDSLIEGPGGETPDGDEAVIGEDAADAGDSGAGPNGESVAADQGDPASDDAEAIPPSPTEREEAQHLLPGQYQLASVEGESLPVTIGEGPECDLQLANGDLAIRESLDFLLRATVHQVCGGELASENVHRAEGRILPDGSDLRFNARYDSLFATAYGRRLDDGEILIERLDTEGGPQEVEWRFLQ